jgi:hypothetical protein
MALIRRILVFNLALFFSLNSFAQNDSLRETGFDQSCLDAELSEKDKSV